MIVIILLKNIKKNKKHYYIQIDDIDDINLCKGFNGLNLHLLKQKDGNILDIDEITCIAKYNIEKNSYFSSK